jgi:hypothetical protein
MLKAADLETLNSMAAAAPEAQRAGLIAVARRYAAPGAAEVRKPAAAILGRFASDRTAAAALLEALNQDASVVAPVAAGVLRQTRDLAALRQLYKQFAEPAKHAGLSKASADENAQLRAAVIRAAGDVGGDEAARALRQSMWDSSPDVLPALIAALESAKSPKSSVTYLSDLIPKAGPLAPDVIGALTRVSSANREAAVEKLQFLSRGSQGPPDISAIAADALEDLGVKPTETVPGG